MQKIDGVKVEMMKSLNSLSTSRAFSSNFEKRPLAKIGKKLGEINNIEHNKGSKIYLQNQVILDCNMSSIPLLKHKC